MRKRAAKASSPNMKIRAIQGDDPKDGIGEGGFEAPVVEVGFA